jgi:hypothetical protein
MSPMKRSVRMVAERKFSTNFHAPFWRLWEFSLDFQPNPISMKISECCTEDPDGNRGPGTLSTLGFA